MMKKILFFTFVGLLMALTSSGQTASDTLQQANDSVTIGSHTEFSAAAQENSVTKAEGDRKSTRLNSSHTLASRMPSSA